MGWHPRLQAGTGQCVAAGWCNLLFPSVAGESIPGFHSSGLCVPPRPEHSRYSPRAPSPANAGAAGIRELSGIHFHVDLMLVQELRHHRRAGFLGSVCLEELCPRWRFSTEGLALQRKAVPGWARLSLCKELEEGAARFFGRCRAPKAVERCCWNGTQLPWNCASILFSGNPPVPAQCWVSLSQCSTRLERVGCCQKEGGECWEGSSA